MSTVQTLQIATTSPGDTLKIALGVGSRLRGGETVELVSDLGGGKTTFVQGLAKGMRSHDKVHSPSFTLSNEYKSQGLTLYHFDFYRLSDPGIIRAELEEALTDPNAVTVIEWGNIVQASLPPDRLVIHIEVTGDNSREFSFQYPKELHYLLPG